MFVAEDMYKLGSQRSAIRELFEYGKQRAAVVGAENVYDFSLGNPTVPAPDCVNETIRDLTLKLDSINFLVSFNSKFFIASWHIYNPSIWVNCTYLTLNRIIK